MTCLYLQLSPMESFEDYFRGTKIITILYFFIKSLNWLYIRLILQKNQKKTSLKKTSLILKNVGSEFSLHT